MALLVTDSLDALLPIIYLLTHKTLPRDKSYHMVSYHIGAYLIILYRVLSHHIV